MEVRVEQLTPWSLALDMAKQTVGKPIEKKIPSAKWIHEILRAEHSPIRCVEYLITVKDVPYYVIMHLVRHHIGIEKFVSTSRPDRTGGKDRHELPQDALVNASFVVNAQALINISRVRLCSCASKETRLFWTNVKEAIKTLDPIMAKYMVPNCIYKGFCPEMKPCGLLEHSAAHQMWRKEYEKGYNIAKPISSKE